MMKTEHKDMLVSLRPELVDSLNMRDGLYTQLIARKVLSARMVRTLQNGRSPDQQAEELLNLLPMRGPQAFEHFCDSLICDMQEHVVDLLKPGRSQMPCRTPLSPSKRRHSGRVSPTVITIREESNENHRIQFIDIEKDRDIDTTMTPPTAKTSKNSNNPEQQQEHVSQLNSESINDKESRHVLKHFITDPTNSSVRQIDDVEIELYPVRDYSSNKSSSRQEAAVPSLSSSPSSRLTPPPEMSRGDSLDTMTTKLTSNPIDTESPVKKLRKELSDSSLVESEDEGIDLTDGPVNVAVERCTRQFYFANCKNAYSMKRIPRGKAIIINVDHVDGKGPRRGTDIDRDNMLNLLCQLHFNVEVYNDRDGLDAKDIVQKLHAFSQLDEHKSADCCVICLFSHGEDGFLFGNDGLKIPLSTVFSLFDNVNCPALQKKPKIFIIQACRGGALDRGVTLDSSDETDCPEPDYNTVPRIPSQSDMVLCYPTQEGYYAWRNRERGSWYIEAIVQVFMKYAKCEDLCEMLHRVNNVVSRKVSHSIYTEMDQMTQMSEYTCSLRRPKLYFYPGIGSAPETRMQ